MKYIYPPPRKISRISQGMNTQNLLRCDVTQKQKRITAAKSRSLGRRRVKDGTTSAISWGSVLFLISAMLIISGCGKPVTNSNNQDPTEYGLSGLSFGSDRTFEVMTWNLEHFAKAGLTTVDYVAQVIFYLDIDVVGLQEIEDSGYFTRLVEELNNLDSSACWVGYRAGGTSDWQELAYIINICSIQIIEGPYEIYDSEGTAFPREPYVLKVRQNGRDFICINNHLKCCGNGMIENDDWDEENRRQAASLLLEDYIADTLNGQNVIVIGDYNDEITDVENDNVFWNFISQSGSYKFTDMDIAKGSSADFSYPTWPSQIDHILITASLFDEFDSQTSAVRVIRVDDYLENGWSEYDQNISDHRPVAWRFTP